MPYMRDSDISEKVTREDEHTVQRETVYSSLAHFNFPPGSMDDHKHIMQATPNDVPRIRTWVEYKRKSPPEDLDAPSLFYQANGEIKQLLTVEHSQEVRDILNQKGLHIYLYEPLCLYYKGDPLAGQWGNVHNYGFYTEFPNEYVPDEHNRTTELDSIDYYIGKNGLHNVHVHTGDYRADTVLPYYSPRMNLYCDDPFLLELMMYDNADDTVKRKLEKRFVCTNWRWTSVRAAMCALLKQIDDANIVWFFDTPEEVLGSTPWMNFKDGHPDCTRHKQQLLEGLQKLNAGAPYTHDVKASKVTGPVKECAAHWYPEHTDFDGLGNPVIMNPTRLPLQDLYRNAFVDIVNESRFGQPTGNISEKVLQSMQFKTPFLLCAPPYSLRYLKEMGYKTFDRWWDESYDNETNHLKRFDKIVDIINWIAQKPIDELYEMYIEMWPVLEHNYMQVAKNSRLGRITHLEVNDLKNTTLGVEWAQPEEGPTLAEIIEMEQNNREF